LAFYIQYSTVSFAFPYFSGFHNINIAYFVPFKKSEACIADATQASDLGANQ